MNELKMDRKSRYTRMVLQDSLMELMKEKPISKITIKELCEKADINRTTFYKHYTDQFDLLRKIETETLSWADEMIVSIIGQTKKHEMINILEETLQYFADNKKHIQILMSEQGDHDFQKQLFTLIYSKCGITPISEQSPDLGSRELSYIFIVNGSIGLIQHWLKGDAGRPVKDIAEIIYTMALQIK